ncbi:CAP domain-containing protein [Flavobacterium laiguense]
MNSKFFRLAFFAFILSSMYSCSTEDSSSTSESQPSIVLDYQYSPLELETMALINNHRVSLGLNALEKINHISYKSEEHNHYMIANNVVNHNDFIARSENIMKVLGAKNVSENIAYNYNSAKGVFDAWLNSEGHRENIEGNYTHFGIAIRENSATGKKYYTNIFVKI